MKCHRSEKRQTPLARFSRQVIPGHSRAVSEISRPNCWTCKSKSRKRLATVCKSRPTIPTTRDRKSTRLNSSHGYISYAVFCLKKKKNKNSTTYMKRHKLPRATHADC